MSDSDELKKADPAPPEQMPTNLPDTRKLPVQPPEKHGIQEILDVNEAAKIVLVFLIERLRDGLGLDDAVAALGRSDVLVALKEAVRGAEDIPAEVGDLSFEEIGQLGAAGFSTVEAVVKAIRGEK